MRVEVFGLKMKGCLGRDLVVVVRGGGIVVAIARALDPPPSRNISKRVISPM